MCRLLPSLNRSPPFLVSEHDIKRTPGRHRHGMDGLDRQNAFSRKYLRYPRPGPTQALSDVAPLEARTMHQYGQIGSHRNLRQRRARVRIGLVQRRKNAARDIRYPL